MVKLKTASLLDLASCKGLGEEGTNVLSTCGHVRLSQRIRVAPGFTGQLWNVPQGSHAEGLVPKPQCYWEVHRGLRWRTWGH